MAIIRIKRSVTANSVPTLVDGELAINQIDKKLYTKDSSGNTKFIDFTSDVEKVASGAIASALGNKISKGAAGDAYGPTPAYSIKANLQSTTQPSVDLTIPNLLNAISLNISRSQIPNITLPIATIKVAGYNTPGDGGESIYVRGSSSGPMAIQDAAGNWWQMSTPDLWYAEAFGARSNDDGPIFQLIYNLTGGTIRLRAGFYNMRSPVITGSQDLTILGVSQTQTILVTDVAGDMFRHGVDSTPAYQSALRVMNVRVTRSGGTRNTSTNKIPGYAFNVKTGGAGVIEFTNVLFDSFSNSSAWEKFILITGPAALLKFTNVRTNGSQFETTTAVLDQGTDVGIHLYSPDNSGLIYQVRFQDCDLGAVYNAVKLELAGPVGNTGSIEGISFIDCGGRTVRGAWIKQVINIKQSDGTTQAWYPPGFWMQRCNFQGAYSMLDMDSVSELHISENFHYIEGAVDRAHTVVPHMINIGACLDGSIHNNSFYTFGKRAFFGNPGNYGVQLQSFINISKGEDIHIRDNRISFESTGSENVGYGMLFGDSTNFKRLSVSDNAFDGGGGLNNPWPYGDNRRIFYGQWNLFSEGFDVPTLSLIHTPDNNLTGLSIRSTVDNSISQRQIKVKPADANGQYVLYVDK